MAHTLEYLSIYLILYTQKPCSSSATCLVHRLACKSRWKGTITPMHNVLHNYSTSTTTITGLYPMRVLWPTDIRAATQVSHQ